jgi:ABC-2 type transport system permease protein
MMSKNLFFKEMRRNAMSLLLWIFVITLLVSFTMSVYETFVENRSKVMGMLSLMPKGALEFKGISNVNDLTSVLGFYAVNNVIYMMVLGSIFAMVLGSNILLKEEYNKTAEYLLTKPLTRSEVFFSKLSVILIHVVILNFVTALAGFISMKLVQKNPFSISAFLILTLYTLMLNMLFGAAGLFFSNLVKRPRPITTFGIGLVLFLYFIFTLSKITESAASIGYISPFKYVDMEVTSPAYHLAPWNVIYFVGFAILLTALSYRLYCRKDIYL